MATHDHYTTLAIRSIFLGARIHDAAVLCGKTDGAMRDVFISFCKQKNPNRYNQILIQAVHENYTTTPTKYLREHVLDFIPLEDLYPKFMMESLEEIACVSDYLNRCLGAISADLSLWRARRDSWDGLMKLVNH
ncbi:hypothetical protein [Aliivibrio sp. S2MY1]|uniref:hypothetical protein n=1 Tax=Aliivibrio sp. S2MY1 TaxID=3028423 RepID=UPI002377DBFD|nr:hypothetical protein [Aliivibrio sp. S2MY1]MDD9200791.1 hypothetical protein [Aliivibrio sp. S2MY1]